MKKEIHSIAIVFGLLSYMTVAVAQQSPATIDRDSNTQNLQAIKNYWTPERMRQARPAPVPRAIMHEQQLSTEGNLEGIENPPPGLAPGSDPDSESLQPGPDEYTDAIDNQFYFKQSYEAQPMHGPVPTDPTDSASYAPFQRWTWFGRYLTYPMSTVGKLFFTRGNSNYVCTASVIQKNTIATAGHCVSDGQGNFATNFLFCPSYNANGINPATGCWAGTFVTTTFQYHNSGAMDRDFACIVTSQNGTIINNNIGNVTGWTGRAYNWDPTQATMSLGYPAASPFNGNNIMITASTEWYTVDMTNGDGLVSKYMGSDQTGGSSGGPWWLNMAHRNKEIPDTDGISTTDPGQNASVPFINGVNSHARCKTSCYTPPDASGGTFWQEVGSPQFTKGRANDNNESEDIFATCFNNGGT